MSQKLLKCFMFNEDIRSKLTFSDPNKIRLNPTTSALELSPQGIHRASGKTLYSTDADLHVQVEPTNPQSLKQWLGFSVSPRPTSQPDQTSVGYRLNDGTNDYFWDGTNWVVAGSSDWNTEQVVAANIATFPAQTERLGLSINLATSDRFSTPTVNYIDLLMDVDVAYIRSIVVSLIRSLREKIQPKARTSLHSTGSNRLSLQDLDHTPNIKSVVAVYNHKQDPEHKTNLFSAYDATSKVITLTASQTRGDAIWVEYLAEPEVYLNFASQDYTEVEKLPAVVVDGFTLTGGEVAAQFSVGNINDNTAVVRKNPVRLALNFDILLLAESKDTLLKMMDASLDHALNTPLLHWQDVDEHLTLRMVDEGIFAPRPNLSDIHQTQYTLTLDDVFLWLRPEETFNLIEQFNLTMTVLDVDTAPRWTGVK